MCFEPNPLHHTMHLKGLETKFLGQSFDHSKPHLAGWRAERQVAEFSDENADRTGERNGKPATAILKTGKFAAFLRNLFGVQAVG